MFWQFFGYILKENKKGSKSEKAFSNRCLHLTLCSQVIFYDYNGTLEDIYFSGQFPLLPS